MRFSAFGRSFRNGVIPGLSFSIQLILIGQCLEPVELVAYRIITDACYTQNKTWTLLRAESPVNPVWREAAAYNFSSECFEMV